MFSFKIKQAPLIGQGPAEVGAAIERGEAVPAGATAPAASTPAETSPGPESPAPADGAGS